MRNRKYSNCCNKPAYHHEVFKQLWKCSQCWKLCKVHNHIVDADKMPVGSLRDEINGRAGSFEVSRQGTQKNEIHQAKLAGSDLEELARIFNRTDDKEELYKEVSKMIKKLQSAWRRK